MARTELYSLADWYKIPVRPCQVERVPGAVRVAFLSWSPTIVTCQVRRTEPRSPDRHLAPPRQVPIALFRQSGVHMKLGYRRGTCNTSRKRAPPDHFLRVSAKRSRPRPTPRCGDHGHGPTNTGIPSIGWMLGVDSVRSSSRQFRAFNWGLSRVEAGILPPHTLFRVA